MSSWLLSSCLGVCVAWSWLGIILAFLLVYFGGQGNILCSALLPVITLLYQACCRAISSTPKVSRFLLHFYASAFACAHSFTVLHALGILAYFRVVFLCAWVRAGCGRQGSWLCGTQVLT